MKPKLLVLQGKNNFHIKTYVESKEVKEHFDVFKAQKIKDNPDLIFCQAYGPFVDDLINTPIPYVIHLGGNPWLEFSGKRLEKMKRLLLLAAHVACVSDFLAGEVQRGMGGKGSILGLPMGLWGMGHTSLGPQSKRFDKKRDYNLHNPVNILIGIALRDNPVTKTKWSGIEIFLEAAKDLIKKWNIKILCAGKSERGFFKLEEWKEKYNFESISSSHLMDKVDRWPEYLEQADLFLHPSTFDCWPRVVAEAMMVGVPTLVFDVTGNGEVGKTTYKVKPENVGQMVEKIDCLLSDERERRLMGIAHRYEAEANNEKHKGDYARLLLNVLERSKK